MSAMVYLFNFSLEWCQIFVLDSLITYIPLDWEEAEMNCDRIVARLSHINQGVVFSAIKLILNWVPYCQNKQAIL